MRFIVFPGALDDGAAKLQELGPKAGYLADLTMSGVDVAVPPWFVILPSAFDTSLDPAMARQLVGPAPDWGTFEALRPADAVLQEIADAWRVLGSPAVVAVRASAPLAADHQTNSHFMGVFDSFCPVLPAVLPDRVADIWRSAFSEEAIGLRHQQQQSGALIPAVMVQARINARFCGGVMTADPRSGARDKILVSAILGGTDMWQALQQEGRLPNGQEPLFCQVDREHGTIEPPQSLLSSADMAAIKKMAERIEAHFATPVDVDWAIDPQGQLYVLQVRLLRAVMPQMPVRYWQNITDDFPAGWAHSAGLYAARLNHGWQILCPGTVPPFANIGGALCVDRALFWAGFGAGGVPEYVRGACDGIMRPPHLGQSQASKQSMIKTYQQQAGLYRLKRQIPILITEWQRRLDAYLAQPADGLDPGLMREQCAALASVSALLPYALCLWPQAHWTREIARLEHRWLAKIILLYQQDRPAQDAPPPRGIFYQYQDGYCAETWWPFDHQRHSFVSKVMGLVAAEIDG